MPVRSQAFMDAAGGTDEGYQPLRKIDDIVSSPAFFDGSTCPSLCTLAVLAPTAML